MKNLYIKISFILCALLLSTNSIWAYWTTDRDGNTQADNASIKGYVSKSGSTYYVLDDATERSISLKAFGGHVEHNYNVNGPAAILTFNAKRSSSLAAGNLVVAQRIIGGDWSDKYDKNPGTSYGESGNITLDEKAVELSFYNNQGTGTRYFKDVKVTMASYCTPATTSVSFGDNTYLSSDNKTLKVYWSNMSEQTITKSGDKDRFTVSISSIPSEAGYYGNTVVSITYKRDVVGSHEMKLTINGQTVTVTGTTTVATPRIIDCATASAIPYQSAISGSALTPGTAKHPTRDLTIDGTWTWQDGSLEADAYKTYTVVFTPDAKYGGGYSAKNCTISIPIIKRDQTIDWPLADATTSPTIEYVTGQLMGATATSGLDVAYESSNRGWGYINENGRLVVVVPNKEITIKANQGGNDNWNEAPERTITFTTKGANPNQTTEVTADSITYGQTLSASTLSGAVYLDEVEIPGTLSWVDPSIMPNAGRANHMVLFTPDNTDAYSSVYFEVPVVVAKATPVITWHIGSILRENVRYSHFVESSNKEVELSDTTSNATLLNITDGVLTTGEVENKRTGLTITVSQVATTNYNAISKTLTVAIYPKSESCLPFDPMTGEDFNTKTIAATDGSVEWCNTNEDGQGTYVLPVTYTQRVGIMLGNWKGGGNYSEKSVTLFFSGIPNQISFDYEVQVVSSPGIPWPATDITWILEESADGENYTELVHYLSVLGRDYKSGNITHSLSENTRYVRITYGGNFAGFIKNLRITRKQYIRSDKSSLTFGTEINPLQEPQAITLSYSSLGVCGGSTEDAITVTSSNPAFYVDEETITENVGIEQKGSYTIRVRCNDVDQDGVLTFRSNDGTSKEVVVRSNTPPISTAATDIFQTGTEHNPVSGTAYRAQQTLLSEEAGILADLFNGSTPLFDELYIYGVSESAAASREWEYSPAKGYKVPVVTASNVHTPCFVYKKEGAQYTYVRTFDAATTTLDVADTKTRVLVGYRPEGPATTAIQLSAGAAVSLNNTEIVATNAAIAVNGNASIAARGANIVSSASNAAVQLSGAATLGIEDNWKSGEASAVLALRPAAGYPSIDLGSASGRVYINGTQLELHNATNMAIAHMDGTTEKFDGEVHINDGSIGGAETLGMPKLTFIDGGTFNDGTVKAYTLKGVAKRPRNSRGEIVSRHTMAPAALASGYGWYGQEHLTPDGSAKVNPMLMDEEIWIFNGEKSVNSDDPYSWNKGAGLPGENDDVLINAPMVVSGGELKVKSLTINWEDKGKGIPAVTVNPDGGLTVGEGGIDGIKVNMVNNLALKAGAEGATKGQTGFLRIHPNSAEPMPEATVEFYSTTWYNRANELGNTTRFQCIGTPIEDAGVIASTIFPTGTFLYAWDESKEKWVSSRTKVLEPFKGYDVTQRIEDAGHLFTYTGKLVEPQTKVIPLSYTEGKGLNLLANSFAAPISIEKFKNGDYFVNAEQTIYILNAGTKEESLAQKGGKDAAGKWVGIPLKLASELKGEGYPSVIPAMQGFWVQAKDAGASISLNYGQHIWEDVEYKDVTGNQPLRAPRATSEENEVMSFSGKLQVDVYTETDADCLFMFESERFDVAYEEGYDARRISSEALDIFTIRENDQLSIDATNSFIGTRVGVRTGEETMYTFFFSHLNSEKELALFDWETEQITEITENTEYTFFAEPNSTITDRFEIIEWDGSNKPGVATGVDNVENGSKVHKFIKDNQLFILKNGVLYNATGVLVR